MSTAARPTFNPAIGGPRSGGVSRMLSSKDITAHSKMKYRQTGQNSAEEMKNRNLKTEIDKKESEQRAKIESGSGLSASSAAAAPLAVPLLLSAANLEEIRAKYNDDDADQGQRSESEISSSSDESDNEDDDELELQRELEKIKAERAAAQEKKAREEAELLEKKNRESAMHGNPLIDLDGSDATGTAKVKRRWNDDVVFRNQARDEQEVKKRFVNDTIRNDFHRSFLKKYMR